MAIPSVQGTPTSGDGIGTDATPTLPTGVTEGELLVYAVSIHGNGAFTTDPADGTWTEEYDGTNSFNSRTGVYVKVAGASESAPTVTLSASTRYCWVCFRTNAASVNGTTTEDSGNSTTPTCPTITTDTADCLGLRIIQGNKATDAITDYAPPGTEIVEDKGTSGSNDVYVGVGYTEHASAGATGTAAGTFTNAENWQAITMALAPAGGGSSIPVIMHHRRMMDQI